MDITKKYKQRYILFFIISSLLWLGTCLTLLLIGIDRGFELKRVEESIGTQLLDVFMPLIISYGIGLVVFIFIKEKMRNTIWMANIIMSVVLFKDVGTYIVLGIWMIDEFIIRPIYKTSHNKMVINKEIDKRM